MGRTRVPFCVLPLVRSVRTLRFHLPPLAQPAWNMTALAAAGRFIASIYGRFGMGIVKGMAPWLCLADASIGCAPGQTVPLAHLLTHRSAQTLCRRSLSCASPHIYLSSLGLGFTSAISCALRASSRCSAWDMGTWTRLALCRWTAAARTGACSCSAAWLCALTYSSFKHAGPLPHALTCPLSTTSLPPASLTPRVFHTAHLGAHACLFLFSCTLWKSLRLNK